MNECRSPVDSSSLVYMRSRQSYRLQLFIISLRRVADDDLISSVIAAALRVFHVTLCDD